MPKSPNYSEIEKLQKEAALERKEIAKLQKEAALERKEIAKLQKEAALERKETELMIKKMAEINSAEKKEIEKLQKETALERKETVKLQKETVKLQKETALERKKTELMIKKMAEINSAESKKTELMIKKMAEINSAESKKTELMIKNMAEMYGGLSNNLGKETEEKFYQIFKAHPVLGKISFDEVHKNIYMLPNLEIDILLSNGTALGICEVKRRLKKTDIKKLFEKTLQKFIKFNNPYYNKLNYYVIFACETMDSDVLDETKKHDCFLISSDFKKDEFVIHQSSQR